MEYVCDLWSGRVLRHANESMIHKRTKDGLHHNEQLLLCE